EDRALLHVSAIPLAEASTAAGRSKSGTGYRKRADAQGIRPRYRLLVRGFEAAEQFVSARNGGVECFLGRLLARPHALQFLIDDVADLDEVAETQSLRICGRRVERHLLDRDVRARVLVVVALLLAELIRGRRDRQVTRFLMPLGLDFGLREVVEELADAF